jgi:hypothetical protein
LLVKVGFVVDLLNTDSEQVIQEERRQEGNKEVDALPARRCDRGLEKLAENALIS